MNKIYISGNLNKNSRSTLNKFNKNFDKSSLKPNLLKSMIGQKNPSDDLNNTFRMTALRSTNNKSYFNKSTRYDNLLKQSHPENLKKTMFKSKFDDIQEKEESGSEKEEKDEKKSKKKELNFSFNFDELDECNTESEESKENNDSNEQIDVIDGEGESELFERFKKDDNEDLVELKKLWYGDNLKQSVNFIKKSILKTKSVKSKNEVDKKEKEKNINLDKNLNMVKEEEEEKDNNNNLGNFKLRRKG